MRVPNSQIHLARSVAAVSVTRIGSPPFRPVALRSAALMLIMCLPTITPTVFRY